MTQRLAIFLAPLALLAIGAADAESEGATVPHRPTSGWRSPILHQVRIEQHFRIRITPGTASMPPAAIEEIEEQERIDRGDPRKLGKCIGITSIAAVRPGDGDELLMFLRDDRIVSATLQKHCSARDFYSGFLIEPNPDGAICIARDILHSRSGENCKVRRLRELAPAGTRRFP